jgi:choline-glycine betaine transporter
MGLFAAFNSFIQFQEQSETTSNAIARFIFEGFPFLLAGVAAWAFLLLAVEAFEQIAALYTRSRESNPQP